MTSQMNETTPNAEPPKPRAERRPFQFGLSTLLLIMTLFAVLAAALAGMVRRHAGISTMPAGFFVLMAVAAPMAAMIVASLLRAAVKWMRRR